MFSLTRKEKQIAAFVLLAFLTGWCYMKWLSAQNPAPPPGPQVETAP